MNRWKIWLNNDLPVNLDDPRNLAASRPPATGGSHLQLQGNELFRVASRLDPAEATMAAYEMLTVADNRFANHDNKLSSR